MASRHANSLPTLKKRQQNSPPCGAYSERPLRSRKPVNGLFGCNLAAARAEEQWSDTEQASATPAYSGGQLYKTVESGCCGLICLSFMCIVGISCLFSPIGMLILPVVLSFASQSQKSPVVEEEFVSSSSALSLDDPAFLEGRGGNLDSGGITCNTRCEADLLSLGVKLIILCLTTWKLYVLPVVLVYRRLGIRPLSVSAILNRKLRAGCYKANVKSAASLLAYPNLVSFVLTFADTQLVLHILGLILGGLQRVLTEKTVYVVQVVRSPDGQSKSYRVNGGSIDSVASELLYRYLVDFPVSNSQGHWYFLTILTICLNQQSPFKEISTDIPFWTLVNFWLEDVYRSRSQSLMFVYLRQVIYEIWQLLCS
ncbi:unnamed protein product [Dibothriocephalus latus]|uniref:Uncharacterized protein n=1 Tax=Dibothriocephalus latus TaxID=60516 RepID=A0A3P7N0G5_DIBLA|nr:unnamed protein product [Dibothriocephalus latus]